MANAAGLTLLRVGLVAVAAFGGGTIVATQLGSAVTGYGSARRDSVALRDDLANSVERTATDLSQSLSLVVDGLTPGAQIVIRCDENTLPAEVNAGRAKVCADAALEEIKEEQQQLTDFKRSGAEARALARRLHDELEEPVAAQQWNAVVSAFSDLQRLESSTACNGARDSLVGLLRSPPDGTPARDRAALLARRIPIDPSSTAGGASDRTTGPTVATALIGPRTSGPRCDSHGRDYVVASDVVRRALVDESTDAAAATRRAHAALLDDKFSDVPSSLFHDAWFVIGLVIALIAWLLARSIKQPQKPILVTIVPREPGPAEGDGGQA